MGAKQRKWLAVVGLLVLGLVIWWFGGTGEEATPGRTPTPAATARMSADAPTTSASTRDPEATSQPTRGPTATRARETAGSGIDNADAPTTDADSGLPWIEEAALPREARETLDLIEDGGPFPYDKDGSTFGNFEGLLPQENRGFYREYTVETPGLSHRGARRVVTGDNDRLFYWTDDHYESFARIRR